MVIHAQQINATPFWDAIILWLTVDKIPMSSNTFPTATKLCAQLHKMVASYNKLMALKSMHATFAMVMDQLVLVSKQLKPLDSRLVFSQLLLLLLLLFALLWVSLVARKVMTFG